MQCYLLLDYFHVTLPPCPAPQCFRRPSKSGRIQIALPSCPKFGSIRFCDCCEVQSAPVWATAEFPTFPTAHVKFDGWMPLQQGTKMSCVGTSQLANFSGLLADLFFGFGHWCLVQVHSAVVEVNSQHF